jgi:hypothetical protein
MPTTLPSVSASQFSARGGTSAASAATPQAATQPDPPSGCVKHQAGLRQHGPGGLCLPAPGAAALVMLAGLRAARTAPLD